MASMLASSMARPPSLCRCRSLELSGNNTKHTVRSSTFRLTSDSSLRTKLSFRIRASNPQSDKDEEALSIQEDVNYLWKLGAASMAGAAVIKYGSVVLPEITRASILQALLMIFTPVVIALVLLFRQSYVKE